MTEPPEIIVRIACDAERAVWYVAQSDLDGLLSIEAKTLDELRAKLPDAVRDLIEIANGDDD
jgi:Domain of unknown function (DUF1902)